MEFHSLSQQPQDLEKPRELCNRDPEDVLGCSEAGRRNWEAPCLTFWETLKPAPRLASHPPSCDHTMKQQKGILRSFDPFPIPNPLSVYLPVLWPPLPFPYPLPSEWVTPLLPTPLSSVFLMMAGDELFCWLRHHKVHSMLALFLMPSQNTILLVSFPFVSNPTLPSSLASYRLQFTRSG